jgi:large subunit ribosomal protein L31
MKKGIHPPVHKDATTTCSMCGAVYLIPSTVPSMSIETCRMCHPIYTGKKQVDARGGRVERFKRRLEKTGEKK